MLGTYFKIAWRNLLRNRTLSFINIFGLALGMTFAILIGLWIHFQESFDHFHKNVDRIAMVGRNMIMNDKKQTATNTMFPLADELKTDYPEIERATRYTGGTHSLVIGDRKFSMESAYADPDFLKMFTFPFLKGSSEKALNDPNSVVLTESTAKALFGDVEPVGKLIKLDNRYNIQVSGVVKDIPKNSSIRFDFLAPMSFKMQNDEDTKGSLTRWNNSFLYTIVEVKEGVSMEAVSQKIRNLLKKKDTGMKDVFLFLYPMAKWQLYDDFQDWVLRGGQIDYVRLFGVIGLFVLLIACINFMNLSTAKSEKRAKEVGIRKTIGSGRGQLIAQFLTESMFTAFLAFLLSLAMIQLVLPYLKDLGFADIQFDLGNIGLLGSVLLVCLLTGLVAGSYPALYLSSFLPVKVLKGVIKQGKDAVNFRRVLVVSQFAISMGLIISTVIIFQQIRYAKGRPIGYNPDNLIRLRANDDLRRNYTTLKQDLLNSGTVEAVTKSSSGMTWINNDFGNFSWDGKDPNKFISLDVVKTEWDYEKVVHPEFIAGRSFSREYKTDSNAIILNEAAVDLIGYKNPVGKTMKLSDQVLTIVGVVRNMVMRDPFKPVGPGVILFDANDVNAILIRLKEGADLKRALAAIGPIVDRYNPAVPFEYHFVDEDFEKKFTNENQVAKLAAIFAGLAIFISCLGLFGLAMFLAERRSREVSIRKVLGASISSLWMLLSREFVWMVLIACLIASPITWWLMNGWLSKYDYRISIGWPVFAVAGLLAVGVALLTVSVQAIRAATANPVNRLKTE